MDKLMTPVQPEERTESRRSGRALVLCHVSMMIVAIVMLAATVKFFGLPIPRVHDEFCYLLQAKTRLYAFNSFSISLSSRSCTMAMVRSPFFLRMESAMRHAASTPAATA